MSKKEEKKKLTHIDIKDNGLIAASKVGTKLANTKANIETRLIRGLIKGSNETSLARYKIMQNINMRNFNLEVCKLINQTSKAVKTALKEDKTVNLKPNQVASISSTINKGLVLLQKSAAQTYQRTLNDLFLKVKSADSLKDQLQKHINSGLNLGVVYQNGREYQFDTYFEMKARTDIQVDIKDNLVDSGREAGVIFYITSYYGDCAKDHAEWQGKIYVDDKWDSIAPKDRIDEIASYIKANDIKTVKFVTEDPDIRLTTRPNCRHYFMPISIDEVLGAKTEKDVNKLREERNLNFNGKYKPEKYEALQKQRLNERKIRAEKQEINKLESELALHPENYKNLQSEILLRQDRVKVYQADQRSLIKQYDNLERRYNREALGNRVTLGAEKSQDLTLKSNEGKIKIEKGEIAQASIYSAKSTPLYQNARNIEPIEGYFDITCHSDGLNFAYYNDLGDKIEFGVAKMIKYIKKDATYIEGTPIRLISCYAGNEILAQTIANKLNVKVMAANDIVNVLPNGELKLGAKYTKTREESGEWIVFEPEKRR